MRRIHADQIERAVMNRKKIILLIFAVVAVVIGGYFYAYVKRDSALYNTDYARNEMTAAAQVCADSEFRYTFTCGDDNITGMKVLMSPEDSSKPSGTIRYTLSDADGKSVSSEKTMKISRLKSGKFTYLKMDRVEYTKGKQYTLVIKCDNDKGSGVTVSGQPDNHAAALCYTYVKWDLQTMVIFVIFAAYLIAFMTILLRIFRK